MPLALFLIGIALIVSALRGTERQLGTLVIGDLTGGFLKWLAAIFIIGLLGYIPKAETPSKLLLGLVLLVLFLTNGSGFFAQFQQQTSAIPAVNSPAPTQITQAPTVTVNVQGGGGSGGGGILGAASGALGIAKTIGGFLGL